MVTLNDIAVLAGVNKTTVSKAMNNSSDINRETSEKIKKIAAELGYEKKHKKALEKCLGIIAPELDDAFYSQTVNCFSQYAKRAGYSALCAFTDFDIDTEKRAIKYFAEKGVSGILVINSELTEFAYDTSELTDGVSIPVIRISSANEKSDCDNVWVNETAGIENAVRYLAELGHKDIAFIGDRFNGLRKTCFLKALENSGLKINSENLYCGENRHFNCGYVGANELLSRGGHFSAVFCQYDDIAFGAIRAFLEKGINVPNDVSVIGFDDTSYASFSSPKLTSVNGNAEYLCTVAFRLLKNKMEGETGGTQSVLIKPELIIRESTAKCKVSKLI